MTVPLPPETLARLVDADKRCLWHPFTPQQRWVAGEPLVVVGAEGNELIDARGRRYLDAVSSLWTNVHGHRHPALDAAVREQLDRVAHSTFLGLTHPPAIELAERLVEVAPDGLSRVFYSDNGSTAAEVAVKMAFQAQQHRGETRRTRFATLRDAYHGDTLGAVSVGAIGTFHRIFKPLLFNTTILPAPVEPGGAEEAEALERALALLDAERDTLAAFVFEPLVQGAAGMKMHSAHFVRTLAERARQHGILLVADEVAVGFGRTGRLFAMEEVGLTPDFLCVAKGISGGYLPLAATLTTEAIYEAFLGAPEENKQFFHGHTYTANPLACAVAIASLDLFDSGDVLAHVGELARQMAADLADLRELAQVRSIRQRGVLAGVDVEGPQGSGHRIILRAREHGVILRPLGNTIVLNPPLSLTSSEWARVLHATKTSIVEELA